MSDVAEADRLEGYPHPRESRRLVGHGEAEATLVRAVNSRLPHAWIFGGLRGIGKATLAYRLAKALLAEGRTNGHLDSLESDPQHPVVRRIVAGAHPDLLVVRRPADPKTGKLKSELPVDEVRRLGEFFARHASEGGRRIAIVDSADELNRNAANALLKVLEEPPPGGLLILIAHQPRALLPTIRSRCRLLTMAPLHQDEVREALAVVAPDLKNAAQLATLSAGSVGTALEMAAYDGPGLDVALTKVARSRGRDASAAHTLANEVALAAQAPRFRLLLERLQAAFAEAAEAGDPAGVEAWQMASEMARAEDTLNIDKRSIVLRLLERYAAIGRAA
jgi:DNA polymerase-3 subunit delta'